MTLAFSWYQYGGETVEKSEPLGLEGVVMCICVGVVCGILLSLSAR